MISQNARQQITASPLRPLPLLALLYSRLHTNPKQPKQQCSTEAPGNPRTMKPMTPILDSKPLDSKSQTHNPRPKCPQQATLARYQIKTINICLSNTLISAPCRRRSLSSECLLGTLILISAHERLVRALDLLEPELRLL